MKEYYSQAGQDKWVIDFFKEKQDGFFLDIGAFDGVDISNTYVLEKKYNWKGVCIDADPINFEALNKSRSCICIHTAISKESKLVNFRPAGAGGEINENGSLQIQTRTLSDVLLEVNAPKTIDYISLDIEGAEYDALLAFPFDEHEFIIMTVEHNLYLGNSTNKENIKNLLTNKGYVLYKENVCNIGNDPFEDWYVNPKYINKQ
jgi:FkbM family methyltransferase